MRAIIVVIASIALLAGTAGAAPGSMSFSGRLSTSEGPVNGAVTVKFSIFPDPMVGTAVWTDTISLTADQGLVFAALGRPGNLLDARVFSGADMFLEIVVQDETLTPRLPIHSIPYAIRSSGADSADKLGTLAPADVITRVTPGTGLSGGGAGGEVTLSLDTAALQTRVNGTCLPGSSIQTITPSGGVTCEADDNTTYTPLANGGISISGTNQVSLATCTSGQVLKAGAAGTWACGNDIDTNTTYSPAANGGISISGTNQVSLTTCTAGQVLKAGAGGTWACGNDTDSTYSPAMNGGIAISASNQIGLLTTCGSGQVLKAGAGGTWACGNDANSGGTLTGITTAATSGLTGGCTTGSCSLAVDPARLAAVPVNFYSPTFVDVDTTTVETIAQVTITVPTAGTVLVIATGDLTCQGCVTATDLTAISLFITNTTGGAAANNSILRMSGPPASGLADIHSASNHRVFPVTAGANTFFFRGALTTGTVVMRVAHPHMSVFFSPQ